jgi:hypothetical protein
LRKGKDFFFRDFFMRNLRDMYKMPCKRAALSIGTLLGNVEGVRLLGIKKKKERAYLGPFSWTQRTLKVKSGGHLELWQGTGLP